MTTKVKKKTGRPAAKWKSKANAARIFERMRNGASLREICAADNLPLSKVCEWLNSEEFCEQYASAQEARADKMFDEIIGIADNCASDKDAVAKARLRIDARKWAMGRMCPKKYSDRVNVDVGGTAEVKHNGKVEFAPNDMAIQGITKILNAALRCGENTSMEDVSKK